MATEEIAATARRDTRGTWRLTLPRWLMQRAMRLNDIPEDRTEVPLLIEVKL